MGLAVTFTRTAMLDINNHLEYYRKKGHHEKVRKIRKGIFDAAKRLESQPYLGMVDFKRKNKRKETYYLIHSHYRIYYEVTKTAIFVLGVKNMKTSKS